ncbi:hypothetical protein [Stenotrophomonas rhizophila]|uniref:Uncharacterized protein n=1 Tax=Stenotrophomonas rhizophila TaxID=216778 RepID=A0AAW5PKL3_9GAMM|nr:hypothetical protein [Stenotrophomonas rhizophila]MCS4281104.1 hypothetical protein [Stenotrophomonas rhizophila]
MNILVEADVIHNLKWSPVVELILELAAAARHELSIQSIDELRTSEWFKSEARDLADLLNQVEKSQTLRKSSVAVVVIRSGVGDSGFIGPGKETVISPAKALEFLYTPFQLILENEEFDGAFLLWMSKALKRSDFFQAYRAGKIEFRHAGGKGSIDRSIRLLNTRVWGRKDRRYWREMSRWAGVVIDSDSKCPGHEPNVALVDRISDRVAFSHILKKRAIESYLPKELMLKHLPAPSRTRVEALFELTTQQRKHYHMKSGLRVDGGVVSKSQYIVSQKPLAGEKTLFSSITDSGWSLLSPGFGSSLAELYVNESTRPDGSGYLDIIDPDDVVEMNYLFDKIMEAC